MHLFHFRTESQINLEYLEMLSGYNAGLKYTTYSNILYDLKMIPTANRTDLSCKC